MGSAVPAAAFTVIEPYAAIASASSTVERFFEGTRLPSPLPPPAIAVPWRQDSLMHRTAPDDDLADEIRDVMELAGRLSGDRTALREWIEAGRRRAALPHVPLCSRCSRPDIKAVYEPAQERVIDIRSRQRHPQK